MLPWANPVMSLDRLVLAAVWTTSIVVGALLEERDLMSRKGVGKSNEIALGLEPRWNPGA